VVIILLFLSGPVPVLFADDPAASLAALGSDTARPIYDLNRIYRTLLQGETVSVAEALEITRNPREGEAVFPFKKANKSSKKSTPAAKKQKHSTSSLPPKGSLYLNKVYFIRIRLNSCYNI
jgi:hypothetical protein